jgi:hypothetical protein
MQRSSRGKLWLRFLTAYTVLGYDLGMFDLRATLVCSGTLYGIVQGTPTVRFSGGIC